MLCNYHDNTAAEFRCEQCKVYLCKDCIKAQKIGRVDIYICRKCHGKCESIQEIINESREFIEINEATNFWMQLPKSFVFPFKGEQKYVIFSIPIIYTVLGLIVMAFPIIGLPLTTVISIPIVYVILCGLINIVKSSALSYSEEPPDWPDIITDFIEWIRDIFFLFITFLICFLPLIYFFIAKPTIYYYMLFYSLGFYIFPMCILSIALKEGLASLNPVSIILSIVNTLFPYTAIVIFWLILLLLGRLIEQTHIYQIPVIGMGLYSFSIIYFIFVSMRPLGILYRAYKERFIGFD